MKAYEALASSSLLSNGVKVKRSIKSTFALDGVSESKTQSPEENKKKPSRISNRTAKIARGKLWTICVMQYSVCAYPQSFLSLYPLKCKV